jgi:hypothetical protein
VPKVSNRLANSVVALARWTYEAKGLTVAPANVSNTIPALLVRSLNRVEAVISADFDEAVVVLEKRRGDAVGEIWVLAPLDAMGLAHASLRGHVDRLVPWWIEGAVIKFGSPRVP